jgi:hypothetical protein
LPWEEKKKEEEEAASPQTKSPKKISNTKLAVAVGSSSKNYNSLLE